MSKIRVLVCDDMQYITMFLSEIINTSQNCECVGVANNDSETLEKAKETNPDIILLDIQMDDADSGIKLIPVLLEQNPDVKIIVISVSEDDDNIFKAIAAGAQDYIFKNRFPNEIISSIERIYEGKTGLRSELSKKILARCDEIEKQNNSILYVVNKMMCLSTREMETLKCFCRGMTYSEVARAMCVEEGTVRTYVSRILSKMQYVRMSELVKDLSDMGVFLLFNDAAN